MIKWIALFSSAYGLALLGGIAAAAAMLLFIAKTERFRLSAWASLVLLALPLGFACSRAYYIVTIDLFGSGISGAFFSSQPYDYAFCGSILGVLLSCAIAARLNRVSPARLLNAIACPGLLLIAAARFAETWSDFGWGATMNAPWAQRFPVSVRDTLWGEWHFALFYPEALYALVLCAALFFAKRVKGVRFPLALIWWSMGQVFFESFRVETLKWGFVRVQQVQCAVFAACVMAVYCFRSKGQGKGKTMLRSWLLFIFGVAAVVFLEFALDKLPWPRWIDYAAMALVLTGMALTAQKTVLANPTKSEEELQ